MLVCCSELMEDLSTDSEAAEEIKDAIRDSFLDTDFESKYMPVRIQLIHNQSLVAQFEGMAGIKCCKCFHFIFAGCSSANIFLI